VCCNTKVVRALQHKDKTDESMTINLATSAEKAVQSIWEWDPRHMLDRRVQLVGTADAECTTAVIDGNCKLARRVCGQPLAELLHSEPLGKYTAVRCSRSCCYKQCKCQQHAKETTEPIPVAMSLKVCLKRTLFNKLGTFPESMPFVESLLFSSKVKASLPACWATVAAKSILCVVVLLPYRQDLHAARWLYPQLAT